MLWSSSTPEIWCMCNAHVPSAKTFSTESASTAVEIEIEGQSALNAAPGHFSLTCSQLYPHSLRWESKMIYCTWMICTIGFLIGKQHNWFRTLHHLCHCLLLLSSDDYVGLIQLPASINLLTLSSTTVTQNIAFRHNVMPWHTGSDGAACVLPSCNRYSSQPQSWNIYTDFCSDSFEQCINIL